MRLTKYAHSCLRVEHDGGVLVVDPGVFSDPAVALDGADAVLITHQHPDHLDLAALRLELDRRPFPIHGPASLAETLGDAAEALHPVTAGQSFTAAGVAVRAYGGRHAVIHPDIPVIPNNVYRVDGTHLHPGDSLSVVPAEPVEVLFLPTAAPWQKLADAVDYLRAVKPRTAVPIHQGILAVPGMYYGHFERLGPEGTTVRVLDAGEAVPL
jgi:L-ascorbate metabolism protein UlaG (beta-lactamase superfamily)